MLVLRLVHAYFARLDPAEVVGAVRAAERELGATHRPTPVAVVETLVHQRLTDLLVDEGAGARLVRRHQW